MADTFRYQYGETNPVLLPVDSATVIEVGDLVAIVDGQAVPAQAQSDQGTEQSNQSLFASQFAGVAMQRSRAGETLAVRIATSGVFEFAAPAIDVELGDLLGGAETNGETLEGQQLKPVRRPELAVALAAQSGTGLSRVLVRLVSRMFGPGLHLPSRYTTHPRLLGETLTLDCDDGYLQVINPNGANRDVILPNEAASRGLTFAIVNAASTAHTVTVKASNGSTTISTLPQNAAARLECDGITWRGLVGTHG